MKRVIIAAFCSLGLASACVVEDEGDIEDIVVPVDDVDAIADLIVELDPDAACNAICRPCPPGQLCIEVCEFVGNCTNNCLAIGLCIEGYEWNTVACNCLPVQANPGDPPGPPGDPGPPDPPEECGPSTCPAGQVCCNESCGICTDPGEFCIQIFCEPV